jgi:alpha-galactosidase
VKIFKTFGYFNTESSQHMSEYVPYFRRNESLLEKYNLRYPFRDWDVENRKRLAQEEEMRRFAEGDGKIALDRSDEYASKIIRSIETGIPSRINGNVANSDLINNLPSGCCVEVPCLVDKSGVQPTRVGRLSPQCAALNRTNINVQELAVLAAVERSKTLVLQAILLDPLTSAILDIDGTHSMMNELFAADEAYLKGFS